MMRNTHLWLPSYIKGLFQKRSSVSGTVHVLFCMTDHYEPDWGGAAADEQLRRVERWCEAYPRLVEGHRDSEGRPPRYSFFYPAEAYRSEVVERLAGLCRKGFGEVEVHLHHDGDTSETLTAILEKAKRDFSSHGLLSREKASGAVRFGFIHGNWALDNSRPDGRWCGVNDELRVLKKAGCYADFTLPSAPSPTQTRKINSIYHALDDPERPKSHDTGRDAAVGQQHPEDLLIVQGPLSLSWRSRKYGCLPRIENGELSAFNPPSAHRADLWVREGIHVRGREEWVFVKIYTHGAKPANANVVLGPEMRALFSYLERVYNDGSRYQLHYVTARELYNIIRAAEAGKSGDPGRYRDYELLAGTGEA